MQNSFKNMPIINWIELFWILCNICEVGGILLQRQSIWITTGRTRVWGSRGCYWGKWKWKRERKSVKRLNLVHQIFVETLQQTSAPAASGDQMTASEKVKVNTWVQKYFAIQLQCFVLLRFLRSSKDRPLDVSVDWLRKKVKLNTWVPKILCNAFHC